MYRIVVKYSDKKERLDTVFKTLDDAKISFSSRVAEALRNGSITSLKLMDEAGVIYALWEA